MSEGAVPRMSAEEFREWGLHQELRYELINGVPVAMAGAKQRHDRIVTNVHGILYNLLRGHKCRNFTADLAVRIPAGNIRRPDAGIDCGAANDEAAEAAAPWLVLEVLSPSTRAFDMLVKLEEYKTVPALAHIDIVNPDTPQVSHWSRVQNETWHHQSPTGPDATIRLAGIEGALNLATIYDGLTFRPQPRLMQDGGPLS